MSIEQQTQIMQLTVQLESSDGQLQAQVDNDCDRQEDRDMREFLFLILETNIGYEYG